MEMRAIFVIDGIVAMGQRRVRSSDGERQFDKGGQTAEPYGLKNTCATTELSSELVILREKEPEAGLPSDTPGQKSMISNVILSRSCLIRLEFAAIAPDITHVCSAYGVGHFKVVGPGSVDH